MDYMIDIETLGTRMDSVIMEVAVVGFNRQTGEIYDKYVSKMNVTEQINNGRRIYADTLMWWIERGDQLRDCLNDKSESVYKVLQAISFIIGPDDYVWSKGPEFDIAMLGHIMDQYNMTVPWDYRKVRSVRNEEDKFNNYKIEVEHNALSDCLDQIKTVIAAYDL